MRHTGYRETKREREREREMGEETVYFTTLCVYK